MNGKKKYTDYISSVIIAYCKWREGMQLNADSVLEIETFAKEYVSERQHPTEIKKDPDAETLRIGDVNGSLPCPNCGTELQLEVKEMTNSDILKGLKTNDR